MDGLIAAARGIAFRDPYWLWLALLSLAVLAVLIGRDLLLAARDFPTAAGQALLRHPRIGLLQGLQRSATRRGRRHPWLRWTAYALLLSCLHVALAYPYRQGRQLPAPPVYRDSVFLLDTSLSMVLRDYTDGAERIDRMTMLKSVMHHLIDRLDGNRIGLMAFGDQAYTVVPLTADYPLLKKMTQRLQPAVLTGRNSDPGNALIYALQQLATTSRADDRPVLVLLSDVNRPLRDIDPRAVAAHLHTLGFRLYTVGIGASSYQAQENTSGGLLYAPANFALLQSLAEAGGGAFYWADSAQSLDAALAAIQQAERRPRQAQALYVQEPLYQWPLAAALLWLMLLQIGALLKRRR